MITGQNQIFGQGFWLVLKGGGAYYLFMSNPIILIAADHRGVTLKAELMMWLKSHQYEARDLGTHSDERCDASDFAAKLAQQVKADPSQFGVLICGSGHAMAMTANRYRDVRAIMGLNTELARLGREHNDANVLVLAADFMDHAAAQESLKVFLETKFLGGRYAERRDKLTELGGL
jgi:ribose 5-phosphate isomerase B